MSLQLSMSPPANQTSNLDKLPDNKVYKAHSKGQIAPCYLRLMAHHTFRDLSSAGDSIVVTAAKIADQEEEGSDRVKV
jgi:hypothetical protein